MFAVETGLWTFSADSPSQETLDSNPFSNTLIANIAVRESIDILNYQDPMCFYPELPNNNCE